MKMNFKAGVYVITGKSYLCPDNTTKTGDLVIGLDPLEKVDPKNMYAYVVDKSGETQSVSRKYLHLIKKVDLSWQRSIYMTYNDEVRTRLKSMVNFIKTFALEYRESEQQQAANK